MASIVWHAITARNPIIHCGIICTWNAYLKPLQPSSELREKSKRSDERSRKLKTSIYFGMTTDEGKAHDERRKEITRLAEELARLVDQLGKLQKS